MTYITNGGGLYSTPTVKRATSGMLAGEPKNQAPFTNPVLPRQAPTVFQVPTVNGAGPNASSALPVTATSAANNAPTTTSFSAYDPTGDPIYQRIQALGQSQVSQAVAGGDALRKQILIQLGDPEFAARQQFGDPTSPVYGDATTQEAAAANPYSTMKNLLQSHIKNAAGIDQMDNKAGGYYSSTHANQLQDENHAYNQSITDADSSAAGQLTNIVQQILQAQNGAQSANIGALGQATQNLINQAIANGYSFGGFDANGRPILTAPSSGGSGGAAASGASGPLASGADQLGDPYGLGPVSPTPAAANNARPLTASTSATGLQVTSPLHAVASLAPQPAPAQKVRTRGVTPF